jgi:hypothetical protein
MALWWPTYQSASELEDVAIIEAAGEPTTSGPDQLRQDRDSLDRPLSTCAVTRRQLAAPRLGAGRVEHAGTQHAEFKLADADHAQASQPMYISTSTMDLVLEARSPFSRARLSCRKWVGSRRSRSVWLSRRLRRFRSFALNETAMT